MELEIHHNPYHVPIVRSQLTRDIAASYPEIRDGIAAAFDNPRVMVSISSPLGALFMTRGILRMEERPWQHSVAYKRWSAERATEFLSGFLCVSLQ